MLFSVDKIMKLGGKRLHGQVTSIEIDEEASIDDIKKKNQATKKNQPTGYEGATIRIEIMLEKEKEHGSVRDDHNTATFVPAIQTEKGKVVKDRKFRL